MKTTHANEYNSKKGIEVTFCGVITKLPFHSNFIYKNTIPTLNKEKVLLPKVSVTIAKVRVLFPIVRVSLPKVRVSFQHRFFAYISTLILSICTKLSYLIIRKKNKVSFYIYNVKGIHFNLDFINFHKFRILLISYSLLFNLKHQYWCEADYFN